MAKSKKLTISERWDKNWQGINLPSVIKTSPKPQHPYYVDVLDEYFHRFLFKNNDFEFIELGCSPGRWLHYFHIFIKNSAIK